MAGYIDDFTCAPGGHCMIEGWGLDCGDMIAHGGAGCKLPNSSAPLPSVRVSLRVDGAEIKSAIANQSRPDLVPARAAPDPLYGFNFGVQLDRRFLAGTHHLALLLVDCADCGGSGWPITHKHSGLRCIVDGNITGCPPAPGPPPPPVRILSTNASAPRPTIRLDGSHTANDGSQFAIHTQSIDWISIESIAIEQSTSGITVSSHGFGTVEVKDCAFHRVWNRSSVGQRLPTSKNSCSNGWSPCIQTIGSLASVSISSNLFDDFDVAFQPSGMIGKVRFTGNTLTGGNGNCVFFVGSHDWLLANNVFSRDWAPRYFTCGTTLRYHDRRR